MLENINLTDEIHNGGREESRGHKTYRKQITETRERSVKVTE